MEKKSIGLESVAGPFCRIRIERINLNSHEQVKNYLLSQGWQPTQFNRVRKADGSWETTSPRLTEDSFDSIKGELGQLIAKRNLLVHRRRFIKNENKPEEMGILAAIRDNGTVPATGILCNTPTGRTTHRGAICNVPRLGTPYGKEIRELFHVKKGYKMLGADLKQIEARMTAHYASFFDDGAYWKLLQEVDDIHSYNAEIINSDRDTAKSFQYAVYYGAKAAKVSSILGCSVHTAEGYLKRFWDATPGVRDLVKSLEQTYSMKGYIKGLDGRRLLVRAKYKLLNTLIQSGAAIIWKVWGIETNKNLSLRGIYCKQIIAYHDEYEYRCSSSAVQQAIGIIQSAAANSGIHFNLTVPIEADVKVGQNWAEVH